LLNKYTYSVPMLVMTELAHHAWLPWKFSHTPRNWLKMANYGLLVYDPIAICAVRELMESLALEESVEDVREWPRVVLEKTALSRVVQLGDMKLILPRLYPNIGWKFKYQASDFGMPTKYLPGQAPS